KQRERDEMKELLAQSAAVEGADDAEYGPERNSSARKRRGWPAFETRENMGAAIAGRSAPSALRRRHDHSGPSSTPRRESPSLYRSRPSWHTPNRDGSG